MLKRIHLKFCIEKDFGIMIPLTYVESCSKVNQSAFSYCRHCNINHTAPPNWHIATIRLNITMFDSQEVSWSSDKCIPISIYKFS